MRSNLLTLFTFFSVSMVLVGCGGGTSPSNAVNGNVNNTPKANTNNPLAVATPTPEATTNNAPTLTPLIKAYCDAWVKNDEAALRKVYSQDTLKEIERQMKAEKEKSLLKFNELDRVSGTPCELRNEEIKGDGAVAEFRANIYPGGIKFVFVRENGEWKLTTKSPAVDSVKQSANSSNAAK